MNGVDPVNRPTMMDLKEAARATGGRAHGAPTRFAGVTTDSRRVIDCGRRLVCGFNMARTLLSSVDGRAIDGAGNQVRP